jgi:glycopeptide antibiotics resistance protein
MGYTIFFPAKKLWLIAVYTYGFALAIEISQLYHAPWIDRIRVTFLGKMILGFGFLWSDVFVYAIGVLIGWLVATLIEKRSSKNV